MVKGAVGSRAKAVPQTTTLCAFAASRSIAALRMPEVISSFSFGSAANSVFGNAVRSRMARMISKSSSAEAASPSDLKGFSNTVRSTWSLILDQSAEVSESLEIVVEDCTARPRHRKFLSWRG